MSYYTNLFTPETWDAFRSHGGTVCGFRERQQKTADRIKSGDRMLCYLVHLSRWCGVLEVVSGPYTDSKPIFSDPDPYVIRFDVRPLVALDIEHSIPIFESRLWSQLSITRDMEVVPLVGRSRRNFERL
jgi:predicted RNA-binding protein